MAGNRQYKSDVFSMLLEEPKNALEVFNAVNGTDYDDPSKVEIYLLEHCKVLKEYMFFVDRVRYYVGELGDEQENLETAIERAIDDCIKNHILEEFLKSRRGEVVKVVQLDYTWERREELIRREEYEEGLEVGIKQGECNGINIVFDIMQKLKDGVLPKDLVAQGFDVDVIERAQMLMK